MWLILTPCPKKKSFEKKRSEKEKKMSVHRHGHHCHSSPLAEVRIPRRAAARAHFLVINKVKVLDSSI